jgi:hypothetical protein
MIVTIEGVITSKELIKKDTENGPKISTELLLAQTGEKMQTPIRLQGDKRDQFELFEVNTFTGELLSWKTRDGIGNMIMVRDENE